jgi:transcriptional regulator with XRE-family HTH domain
MLYLCNETERIFWKGKEVKEKGRRTDLGDRLRKSAQQAGLSSDSIAEALGITGAAVRKWWLGDNEPSVGMLQRYADICEVSPYWLMTGNEDPSRLISILYAVRRLWRAAVARGEDASSALARILEDENILPPEERQRLSDQTDEIRLWFEGLDEEDWVELTPEQHRLVKDLVRMLGQRQQRESDPPTQG